MRALPTFVPVYLFPAMNTHMYSHPLTAKQLKMVQEELGYHVRGPIGKTLACGDVGASMFPAHAARNSCLTQSPFAGLGAMTEWTDIVQLVVDKYDLKKKTSPS